MLQALLRQAAVQHRQGQSLPPSQRGSGVSGDAFRRATSADYASTVQQMPVVRVFLTLVLSSNITSLSGCIHVAYDPTSYSCLLY